MALVWRARECLERGQDTYGPCCCPFLLQTWWTARGAMWQQSEWSWSGIVLLMLAKCWLQQSVTILRWGRKCFVFSILLREEKQLSSVITSHCNHSGSRNQFTLHQKGCKAYKSMTDLKVSYDTLSRAFLLACKEEISEFETIHKMKHSLVSKARLQQIQRDTETSKATVKDVQSCLFTSSSFSKIWIRKTSQV